MTLVYLEVYVERGCAICRRSERLAEGVRERFPDVSVRVVDVAVEQGEHGQLVTATPTFVLNGSVLSLGNPSRAELEAAISRLLGGRNDR